MKKTLNIIRMVVNFIGFLFALTVVGCLILFYILIILAILVLLLKVLGFTLTALI